MQERGDLERDLAGELARLASSGLLRRLPREPAAAIDFCSNDYLGLARDPRLVAAAARAVREHGAGGRASRLLGGGSALERHLEERAAEWLGAEAALLFPSGYQANLGLIPALVGRQDVVLSDQLNHASIIDACRLSRAQVLIYPHGDLEALERLLAGAATARRRLVVSETVFSMDGDLAPLGGLAELAGRHRAALVLDEAHAAGLLGPQGAGAWAALEAAELPPLLARVVTGGKALGAGGALVAGSRVLCELLVNRARSLVFTTAPVPALVAALLAAVDSMPELGERRAACLERARELAAALGLPEPAGAIVPVVVGEEGRAMALAEQCRAAGFEVRAVRPPTVPAGTSRLRLVCHATHRPEEVAKLAAVVAALSQPSHSSHPREGFPEAELVGAGPRTGPPAKGLAPATAAPSPGAALTPSIPLSQPSHSSHPGEGEAGEDPPSLNPSPGWLEWEGWERGRGEGPGRQEREGWERGRGEGPGPPEQKEAERARVASGLGAATAHRALFVVGTDTGVGKTVVSAALLALGRRLAGARYWKPVQTGEEDDTAAVLALSGLAAEAALEPSWRLPLPASPHQAAAAAGVEIDLAELDLRLHRERAVSPLVVELAGGLLVPYRGELTQASWLEAVAPELVLVARSGLGTLNHTLLTLEALRRRGLEPRALFLVGEPHPANRETLARLSAVPRLFELPRLAPLDPESLGRWLVDEPGLAELWGP
ncbi:MAG: dethiobiotin synthase [Thermoanaerobaculia bacterium]